MTGEYARLRKARIQRKSPAAGKKIKKFYYKLAAYLMAGVMGGTIAVFYPLQDLLGLGDTIEVPPSDMTYEEMVEYGRQIYEDRYGPITFTDNNEVIASLPAEEIAPSLDEEMPVIESNVSEEPTVTQITREIGVPIDLAQYSNYPQTYAYMDANKITGAGTTQLELKQYYELNQQTARYHIGEWNACALATTFGLSSETFLVFFDDMSYEFAFTGDVKSPHDEHNIDNMFHASVVGDVTYANFYEPIISESLAEQIYGLKIGYPGGVGVLEFVPGMGFAGKKVTSITPLGPLDLNNTTNLDAQYADLIASLQTGMSFS